LECAIPWWSLTFKSVSQILRQKGGHEDFGRYKINWGIQEEEGGGNINQEK
jgi:hypothetical protein